MEIILAVQAKPTGRSLWPQKPITPFPRAQQIFRNAGPRAQHANPHRHFEKVTPWTDIRQYLDKLLLQWYGCPKFVQGLL
jgi:hypothetical protein